MISDANIVSNTQTPNKNLKKHKIELFIPKFRDIFKPNISDEKNFIKKTATHQ